ncbi:MULTISPECIES: Arc family DNA-binding protein [Acinetobacter]|uniref:Arc family DNA-binding protein n=1 Tax=Acinetobacter piscicola TaxID=2006115 RepID=A0A7S7AHB3_9GAMM|nr:MULTISPECIES: Arc family DNA-binding protein [Acinetobacter]QOW45784.1 Arc family DNA-binding protein [Acinetobacter piscicola]
MSNQTDHTIVRLRVPPELKEKIEKSAEENNRSQSAEMVARLEQSFNTPENTRILLEDAVKLTLQAIKDDPSILNNPRVSSAYTPDDGAKKDTVELINKKAP